MYTTENIISIYGHCIVMWRTIHNVYCAGHVHDKDYHIRIWALYRHLTNICNLAYTYMSIHTIHNVNYSAQITCTLMPTFEHTLMEIYPYMVIFRSYTASVSYWLTPMYVEYSGIDFQYSSQHDHNVNHTAQVYNALYSYCGGCAGFQSKDVQSTQSIYM